MLGSVKMLSREPCKSNKVQFGDPLKHSGKTLSGGAIAAEENLNL
jgi:hypothetical protein